MNRIKLMIDNLKGDNILDVGFIGNYPYEFKLHNLLKKKFKNVFGLDLRYAKVENSIVGNALKMPFKPQSIDSILAGEIIEHFVETEEFLSECKMILKNKGRLIITTPNRNSYLNILFKISFCEDHRRLFSKKDLEYYLKKAGFKYKMFTICYVDSFTPHTRSNNKIIFFIRKVLHKILPENLHEGFLAVCEKL
jgi:ubiquinone/menaquinone biosynthesis C-methylase UbiE